MDNKTRLADRIRVRLTSNADRQRRAAFHMQQLAEKLKFLKDEGKHLKEELAGLLK